MKNFCISFTLFLIIILSAVAVVLTNESKAHTEYLRIHIRADSNEETAQAVKYKVKDAVVEFITPLIVDCNDKVKAEKTLTDNIAGIKAVADKVLYEQGFDYNATVKINSEKFPTRNYGEFTLEEGYYDALIIELGSGKGDNWWCVAYPPLCFIAAEDNGDDEVRYRSVIADFFKSLY